MIKDWTGDLSCQFCRNSEDIDHLLLDVTMLDRSRGGWPFVKTLLINSIL